MAELIAAARNEYYDYSDEMHESGMPVDQSSEEYIADYLLANGVIVPPCKVGDKVFFVHDMCDENGKEHVAISNGWCVSFSLDGLWMYCRYEGGLTMWHCIANDLGENVFLTREEAEKKLEEGENK